MILQHDKIEKKMVDKQKFEVLLYWERVRPKKIFFLVR